MVEYVGLDLFTGFVDIYKFKKIQYSQHYSSTMKRKGVDRNDVKKRGVVRVLLREKERKKLTRKANQ